MTWDLAHGLIIVGTFFACFFSPRILGAMFTEYGHASATQVGINAVAITMIVTGLLIRV